MSGAGAVTICVARGGVLAKTVDAAGRVASGTRVARFNLHGAPCTGLAALAAMLRGLAMARGYAVLRGAIIDPARARDVRRLTHADAARGDAATLIDAPRRWIALDVDDAPLPPGADARDLATCGRAAIATLPPEFRDAACVIQATSRHALSQGRAFLRLWFWTDRPVTCADLRQWLRDAPVDSALFAPAQLIFTAAPIFVGRADPLPTRLVELSGVACVPVPSATLLKPAPRPAPPVPHFRSPAEARDAAHAALIRAARRILEAADGERHHTLIRECCRLLPLIRTGALPEPIARETVRRATEAAEWPDPGKIEAAMTWAFARPAENPFKDATNA